MPYTYTSGQGLGSFADNEPSNSEAISNLPVAERQVREYLKDSNSSATGGPNARINREIEDRVTAVSDEQTARTGAIGVLTGLATTLKTNLVAAINEVLAKIATDLSAHRVATTPRGMIAMFGGGTVPIGWKACDGVGTYIGDDTNSYNVPDMRDKFIVCAGPSAGHLSTGGGNNLPLHTHTLPSSTSPHTLVNSEIPSHRHNIDSYNGVAASCAGMNAAKGFGGPATGTVNLENYASSYLKATGGDGGHSHEIGGNVADSANNIDNRPSFIAVTFIIYVGT